MGLAACAFQPEIFPRNRQGTQHPQIIYEDRESKGAASIPMAGLTAWQVLKERANIKPGHKVFIPAGAGGIGTFAIQFAKYLGAEVATTTSAGNMDLARSLGTDQVIDY